MVTDIGRGDLLLGLLAASECPVGPHISGILCTNSGKGHRDISPHVQHILNVSPSFNSGTLLGYADRHEGLWPHPDACCLADLNS